MHKDVKTLMWDLFQSSGVPQYYALYAALRYEQERTKGRGERGKRER